MASQHDVPTWIDSGIPWRLLMMLLMVFVLFWQLPHFEWMKVSTSLFPLPLHTLTESFSIIVAILVFAVAWNAYSHERADNILILACGFLSVGLIDFAHMLSYRGMPDFVTPASPTKAIDFWLAARLASALVLVVVALRPWQPLRDAQRRYGLLAAALAYAGIVYYLQLWHPDLWPVMFIDGQGLTALKIALEYLIVILLAVPAFVFYRQAQRDVPYDAAGLFTATAIMLVSELCFTLYANVNDIFSLLGHSYKILAYLFIYRSVFVASIREPYERLREEIVRHEQSKQHIEYLAFHDSLTGLPNYRLARHRLQEALQRAQARGEQVAVLHIDLDNFKTINDSLGHRLGDALLIVVARHLASCISESDTLSRQGGDEFVILVPDLSGIEPLLPVLERLMHGLNGPLLVEGHTLNTSISIGIAVAPGDGDDFDTLLRKADTAMYRAKESGRNGYCFFDTGMDVEAVEQLKLRSGLRQALERQEFVLHYQPQFDLSTGKVIGAEALLRWQHPELGMVPPGRFIRIAEESGLIVPIGDWVLREACRQAMAWQEEGLPPMVVAVNLSAIQFRRGSIEEVVYRALHQAGLPATCLELELTESILMDDVDNVLASVRRLKAMGVHLSIDDFGTGYSSLSYLKRFAVDKLKIDQSFVRDLHQDADDAAIVRAIIQMAHGLNLRTVAEGVETAEVQASLLAFGCDEGQGYYFARPMSAEALAEFVAMRLSIAAARR